MICPLEFLHSNTCSESDKELHRMGYFLQDWPVLMEQTSDSVHFCGDMSPLQHAIHLKHKRCTEFFIKRGARIDARNNRGFTALYLAIYGKYPEGVKILLCNGANPNYELGTTPSENHARSWYFYLACSFGFHDIANCLGAHGAVPEDYSYKIFNSAAQVSVLKNSPECLFVALKYGSALDANHLPTSFRMNHELQYYSLVHLSIKGKSFHSKACMRRIIKIWTILREFGANFNFRDRHGKTVINRIREMRIPPKHTVILAKKIRAIMNTPLSLQSLARIQIRKCMGIECHKNFWLLECLPTALQDILDYKNFEQEIAATGLH